MIRCFRDPHPDELLYSICARFSDKMGYPAKKTVIKELFGRKTLTAIADLPKNLDHLCAALPSETNYTFDAIVNNHTLLPLYAPFLPVEQLQNLLEDMHRDTGGPGMHFRAGLTSNHIALPRWLRFCPQCAEEDRAYYGECYWHRVHQVPGVEICPRHGVYLQNSTVSLRDNKRWEFTSAEHAIPCVTPSISASADPSREVLLQIALDATWLLNQHSPESRLDFIHTQYEVLLSDLHLATYQGKTHIGKLTAAFETSYAPALLRRLQCELNESRGENWLVRFLRKPHPARRPIQHLLLMQFLGYSAEAFFGLPAERKPFSNGPWPCLNVVCRHYHQLSISKFDLTYSRSSASYGRPIGIFSCECGFVYSRLGPDKSSEDVFKISSVKSYGVVWEDKLRELCQGKMVSELGIAQELGVDYSTVQRQAARLGLSYSKRILNKDKPQDPEQEKWLYDLWKDKTLTMRDIAQQMGLSFSAVRRMALRLGLAFADSHGRPARLKRERRTDDRDSYTQEERSRQRLAWLSAVRENPELGTGDLSRTLPQAHRWLRYHDSEWLREHSPMRSRGKPIALRVDWESEDIRLAEAVKSSAQRLRNAPGKPVWITRSSIGKDIGESTRLHLDLERLPLTARALAEVAETRQQWAVRRIWWTVDLYVQDRLYPGRIAFIKRAGVRESAERPEIKQAIDAAILALSHSDLEALS